MNHDMENLKQTILESTSESESTQESEQPSILGKLFFDNEQATYTFLFSSQVICLHYDQRRQSLFLNGHRINHFLDDVNMPEFLVAFKKTLLENRAGSEFMRAFDLQVSQIFMSQEESIKDNPQ